MRPSACVSHLLFPTQHLQTAMELELEPRTEPRAQPHCDLPPLNLVSTSGASSVAGGEDSSFPVQPRRALRSPAVGVKSPWPGAPWLCKSPAEPSHESLRLSETVRWGASSLLPGTISNTKGGQDWKVLNTEPGMELMRNKQPAGKRRRRSRPASPYQLGNLGDSGAFPLNSGFLMDQPGAIPPPWAVQTNM